MPFLMLTIEEFRPVQNGLYLLVLERENGREKADKQYPFTFEKTIDGIRGLLSHLLESGFSTMEVAVIAQFLKPIREAIERTCNTDDDVESMFAFGWNRSVSMQASRLPQ